MRVAFLTNVISPYRAPVFRSLARTPGWEFRVLVNARTEFDRRWDGACDGVDVVESRTLRFRRAHVSHEPVRVEQVVTTHVPVGLWRDLSRFRPDVVITHELGPRSLLATLWCRVHRVPYVVWSYQSRAMGSAGGRLRRCVRAAVLGRARAVVGMGRQARDVLLASAVPTDHIVDAPNATDVELVRTRLAALRADGSVARLRAELGAGRRIALFCGRLVPFKGIRELLAGWAALPAATRDAWRLVFVGDGPLAPLIETAEPALGVVRIAGVPMADVPAYYASADLHVFPSLADAWGLTVQEAMLCGVPTLCSIHAGCADDLVRDGVDGLLFDPSSPASLLAGLAAALDRDDLATLGARAATAALAFTPERLAESFRVAVARAMPQDTTLRDLRRAHP
ncbi:MAG: glycosyltransferase family 4 protein [Planctomycetes bacterium]|nr:glycosyltransferase family 4 protein [Planctomycetota bacterium]